MTVADADGSSANDLLPAERRQRLRQWFDRNVAGSNQDLGRLFNASISTVRRDLDQLASEGLVKRTHGGAVRIRRRTTFEPTTDEASGTAREEKHAIALKAAGLLRANQMVMIDTGSTMHSLARVLAGLDLPLTIVTNDLLVAYTLTYRPHLKVIVTGGTCRDGAYTLLGEPAPGFLADLRCDLFFLGAQAVDSQCASDTSLESVQVKRAMIAAAKRTVLLFDSSRSEARAAYRIVDLDDVHALVTDDGIAPQERARLERRNAELVVVSVATAVEGTGEETRSSG